MDTPLFFENDGLKLSYAVMGPESGPPVVFFHGISGSRYTWSAVADKLSKYRVYVCDARGHGHSERAKDKSGYTISSYASDAQAMLEKVVKTPCVVVGHSLGGMQSYLTSVARPDLIKAVLLEDPPLYMLKKEVFDKTPYKPAFEFLYKDIAAFQASGKTAEQITAEIAQRPLPGSTELTHEVVREDALLAQGKARLLQDVRTWEPTFDGTMGDNDENATSTATGVLLQADMALGAAFFPEHVERFKKAAPGIEVVEIKGVRHQIHDSKAHYDEFMRHLEGVLEKAYP